MRESSCARNRFLTMSVIDYVKYDGNRGIPCYMYRFDSRLLRVD
jgi:hypothetical protein